MVFQDYALFPHMTVAENVELRPADQEGRPRTRPRARVAEMLAAVQLEGYVEPPPGAALRRPAPAGRPRPGAGQPARRAAARRAARRARPEAAQGDAARAEGDPAAHRHDLRLRHPRPGGGADDVGPDRGHERRQGRADRRPRELYERPGDARSSPASSASRTRSRCGRRARRRRRRDATSARAAAHAPTRRRSRELRSPSARRRSSSTAGDGGERLLAPRPRGRARLPRLDDPADRRAPRPASGSIVHELNDDASDRRALAPGRRGRRSAGATEHGFVIGAGRAPAAVRRTSAPRSTRRSSSLALLAAWRSRLRRRLRRVDRGVATGAEPGRARRAGDRDAARLRLRGHGRPTRCSTRSARRTRTSTSKIATLRLEQGGGGEARRRLRGRRRRGLHRRDGAADRARPAAPARPRRRSRTSTDLAFSDSDDVRDAAGNVLFVPASAGPARADRQHREIDPARSTPTPTSSTRPTPGNVALEATPLTAIGVSAMALGLDDPMNLTLDEISEAKHFLLDHRDQFRAFAESDADWSTSSSRARS